MLTKTKPLTDEQLNPMRSSAPLLVERYRQLRDHKVTEAAVMIEANKSLAMAREEIQRLQKQVKELELLAENTDLLLKLEREKIVRRFWELSQTDDMVIKFAGMIQKLCREIDPEVG